MTKGDSMDGVIEGVYYAKAAAFLGAAIAMGVGTIGPALGQGIIGAKACENIGKYPESASQISKAMLLAMILVETSAIYALVVSMMILFFSM